MSSRLLGGNRDFTLLWTGGAISAVGSTTSMISYPLLVLTTTGSPGLVGVTMAVGMVTRLLAGLPGGVLVDRTNKKRLMLLCDLTRLLAQGTIALALLADVTNMPLILVMIAVESAFSAVFSSAEPTAVRLVVARDQLAVALARNEARGATAMMVGPPLGGLLFGLAPWLPFAFDALSYLVSFVLVALLRTPMPDGVDRQPTDEPADVPERSSLRRDIGDGLRFLWQQRFLRTTMLLIAGNNLASNAVMVVVIVLSQQRGAAGSTTGLLMTAAGVGTLVGALAAPAVVRLFTVRTILVLNRFLWMVLIAAMAVMPHVSLLGILVGLMFFLGPAGGSAVATLQMRITPEELQGRGRATAGVLTGVTAPVGTAIVGIGLEATSPVTTVLLLAAWMGLMTTIAVVSRPIRQEGAVRVGTGSTSDSAA